MELRYQCLIAKIELSGDVGIITFAAPNGSKQNELLLNCQAVIPREEAVNLRVTDEIIVTLTSPPSKATALLQPAKDIPVVDPSLASAA